MYLEVPDPEEFGYTAMFVILLALVVGSDALAVWTILNYPLQNLIPPVGFLECCAILMGVRIMIPMDHDKMGKQLPAVELKRRGKNILGRSAIVIALALIFNIGV